MSDISIGGRISLLQRFASLDLRYGPYSSIADAYENMGPSGDEVITAGLPFGVTEDDGSVSVYVWTKGEDATQNDCKKLDKEHIVLFNGFIDISVSVKQQSYNDIATKSNIVFLSDRKQFAYRDGLNFYINWKNRYVWSSENLIPYDDVIYIDITTSKSYYFNGTTLVSLTYDIVVTSINNQSPDANGNVTLNKEDIGLDKVDNTADTEKVVKGASEDGSGNVISTTYETKTDATTKQTTLQGAINALQTSVAALTGLDSTNFGGFSIESTEADAISNIATLYTADGYTDELLWYMAGTSLSSVKAYRYNGSGTPTAISSDTYNCVDFSGLITDVSTLSQNLAALGPQLDGVKDRVTATETAIRDLQELFGESVEGYVRVAETSDPKMEFREYKHTKVGEESVFDCYKPCLVGNNFTGEGTCGKILHILNPLDWHKDENGNAVVLDGSMGEVLICNTETLYAIVGHVSVDNVDYDVFLYSRIPFEWNGHRAEELPPTGLSPHYCVSHTDSDNVTRMHSVLNMEWDGSYQAQVDCVGKFVATDDGEGNIVETYDADAKIIGDAKGKSSTGISLPNGEQYAMNINDDNTKTIPYFNSHVDAVEKHHVGLMFAESGTFYLHAATKMGSGFCANVQATTAARWAEDNSEASNGFRYIKHDGTTWGYYPLSSVANFGLGTTGDSLYKACMLNLWRSPWNIFEQQRVLMYAVANHIEELTWFAFEGNIYKYRSVDGLKGLADGVMTGVVWKKLASKLKDGAVEPSTENAVGGNRCEWLISSAVYRGVITDVSPSWWTSGLWMTQWGTDNRYEGWLCRDQSKMLKSSNSNTIDDSTLLPQEQSDDYIKLPTLTYGNGYRKNYAQTLFWSDRIASMSGASIGTYIGAYANLNGTRPAEGKKVARGCRRGAVANYTYLSPLCVYGGSVPSGAGAGVAFGICCRIES